ncbi:hypothetical protein QDR37_07350 [Amnibacterium sp. CER49]|uniref:hypothetical protein n=1 Tax=Amnibacterium sp. CER49 TaxID=3039161 RepID=UPI00244C51D6|nr:hypothetical protein [Amnibacterium sp. CER49]MDH2443757.1 hypothetical protein [Amnibacterium sp. CER49]
MRRKHRSSLADKPWVHLTEDKPFDQTNGVVDFDVEPQHDDEDVAGDLMAKGFTSNTVNAGFFGGF